MLLAGLGLLVAAELRGQLSPGKLSEPHAELEGSAHCLECHQSGEGVSPERCLACHQTLRRRVEAGRGLHARQDYARCQRCHIDHHGREFELIWWGEAGVAAFEHGLTGYELAGAHAKLDCRSCHRPELVRAGDVLRAPGKDLSRTFLGLESESCMSCHTDQHRGQFPAGGCLSCHNESSWRPADRFDHAQAAYALTGRHREVDCSRCHAVQGEGDRSFVLYTGLAFERCTDCHRDPHENRLGGDCERCHSTAGWERFDRAQFDHGRTRFPLAGAHVRVDCGSCHAPGRGFRVSRFERCVDCHADEHLGQFAARADRGACESCHKVAGFLPATFTLQDHQTGDYPLAGAHLAVPCDACHRAVPVAALPFPVSAGGRPVGGETAQFRFSGTGCADCHGNPHRQEPSRFFQQQGCESCHVPDSWRRVRFDHELTRFALRGRHQAVACRACHQVVEAGTPQERLQMSGLPLACADCHQDVHRGQFMPPGGETPCQRCHTPDRWAVLLFDHNRDSIFQLDGAHRPLPCAACHELEGSAGESFVRYKPLPSSCKDCHAETEAQ